MTTVNGMDLMSEFNFTSKYARYNAESSRRESFDEAVDRMVSAHKQKYAHEISVNPNLSQTIDSAFELVKQGRLLASQRMLQFAGPGIFKHEMRGYNCVATHCDRARVFAEIFYTLLCGCGCGISVQKHHIDRLPDLIERWEGSYEYVVEDTIEGWSDALDTLMKSAFSVYSSGRKPHFNYKEIRPKGAPLSTGGKAPGPEPLKIALEKISLILEQAFSSSNKKLKPIEAYDILMHAADAVISGGVRRSATIALFSPDDEEMLKAKTGNWFLENPQRGRSNNSAALIRSTVTRDQFDAVMKYAQEFGEPAPIFLSHRDHIFNPCVEVSLCPILIKDQNGETVEEYTLDILDRREELISQGWTFESGFQACNLTEINASKLEDEEDFKNTVWAAAVIGTLQAGYTETGYLGNVTKEIIEREALLGVSMTGMMDNPEIAFDYELQAKMASHAVAVNTATAKLLGINPAARVTVVKPAGNSSVLLKTSSGIHAQHARRYIRRVQVNKDDPVYQHFRKINPSLSEPSVWSPNKTDDVISFPIEVSPNSIIKDDLTAIEFLEKVRKTQQSWVYFGTAKPNSSEGLIHNVSNTIDIMQNEWSEVADYIWKNRSSFGGLSFLGKAGDYIYQQAPMQKIVFERELIAEFGSANVGAAKHVIRHITQRYGSLHAIMRPLQMIINGHESSDAVRGTPIHSDLLWDTYKKIRQLIAIDSSDEIIYLLACIGHEPLWDALVSSIRPVDYSTLIEESDNTEAEQTIACGGGVCDLSYEIPISES